MNEVNDKERYIMSEIMEFPNREEFREWLCEHCVSNDGIWLLFGKAGGPKTLKAGEALEEALCFGWIDGQMEKIDDKTYKKNFSLRRKNSKWSEKNKALVKNLEERGLMTDFGRKKIDEAKKNGQWDTSNPLAIITEELVLCQEKVQIKCNQFSLFLVKFNLLFSPHSPQGFSDILPHIHLAINIHNGCECVLYCNFLV